MVKLFSEGGAVMRALPFGTDEVADLLIVTNFLDDSVLLVDVWGFACLATTGFFTGAAFAGGAFCAWITLAFLSGTALAIFFTGFATTAFFATGFLTTALRAATFALAFVTTFFGVAAFIGFFAATVGFAFGDGFAFDVRDAVAALRAPTFGRAGACAVFARLLVFGLILAISLAYLVTRRSRVIA